MLKNNFVRSGEKRKKNTKSIYIKITLKASRDSLKNYNIDCTVASVSPFLDNLWMCIQIGFVLNNSLEKQKIYYQRRMCVSATMMKYPYFLENFKIKLTDNDFTGKCVFFLYFYFHSVCYLLSFIDVPVHSHKYDGRKFKYSCLCSPLHFFSVCVFYLAYCVYLTIYHTENVKYPCD